MGNIRNLSKHLQSVGIHYCKSPKSSAFCEGFDKERGSGFKLNFSIFKLREFWRILNLGTSSLLSHFP